MKNAPTAYRVAGFSVALFGAFEFAFSLACWLWLDAFFFDPVSVLLLWLGLKVRNGSRWATVPAAIVAALYAFLVGYGLVAAVASQAEPQDIIPLAYPAVLLAWSVFSVAALVVAFVRKPPSDKEPGA
jgi:hypothetical protein